MNRYEALGNDYSEKGLVKAAAAGYLFDYVATYYTQMSKEELKEVLLAVLWVGLDSCKGETDEHAYNSLIVDELGNRGFGDED